MKKTLITILCTVLACSCVMGVTLAFLMDKTETITNTFTVGKVDIDLKETTGDNYKMIPGATIAKNPKVTVKAGSEACWLFVKITETGNGDADNKYITYTNYGWTALAGETGVYYREVEELTAEGAQDRIFDVFTNNEVTVGTNVTQATGEVTIAVTAYAVQKTKVGTTDFTVAEAWAQAKTASINP